MVVGHIGDRENVSPGPYPTPQELHFQDSGGSVNFIFLFNIKNPLLFKNANVEILRNFVNIKNAFRNFGNLRAKRPKKKWTFFTDIRGKMVQKWSKNE